MGTDRDPGDTKPTQPRDPKMQVARILLPDGVYKEFEVNKTAEGEVLFTQVTQNLSIEEREYFSLCFYDNVEGVRHWLYNDKVIAKQIKSLPWEFSFEVKFYPTTPTTIVDDHARYFVFLQLRRDILTGRLPVANADTHALLGSFVAQMEFGDAPSHISNDYEKFITDSKLVPSSHATPETFKKIAELHRELRGQSTGETEIMFLDHCKHLPLYGIHIFKATDKDKKSVDVGIGAAGVNIYQDEQVAHIFNWQNIIKIGYKRTYFSVKVKAGVLENVKDEKTLYYKLPSYVAAKRVWKCAVEHHTFFRLIQPEEKPHKGFFNFGSQRFRYQGRTQFQTKIASQMFDKPSTVDRAPSAMSQPIASAEDQKLQTLNLTDSELEQRQFERYRRALTPKSYTSSRQDDDEISTATFAKYSRPSTLLVVNTSQQHQPHDLSYSPRDDSSNYSSAAYYMSERSSLRTPSSAYYPPSEYTSPTSPVYFEGQHSGEYHVQMRQSTSAGASGASGARRNLFGRASDARSSKASRDSVRLVSFHEPVDPDQPIHRTHPANELQEIPISHTVTMYYHGGAYERLSPRRQQRPELPYGFGNYTPRNGVSHVDNLQPDGEMDQQPIRFFVDVRHSGASRRDPTKRLSHPGKEDVKEKIDPKDYEFAPASTSDTLHRTELGREVQPANIHQFTRRYHPGQYSQQPDPPQYRLITHVHPLVVSTREESKNGQSSSNVTAMISQKEQIVSTKVRRESPDADRRVRLSASVDRSGNLTDTTEEMARSSTTTTEVTTTTTTVVTTAEKKKKKQKIPPSSKKTDETRSRFGGFFTKKTSQKASDYPEGSGEFSGKLDTTARTRELEASDFQHPSQVPEYSPKKTTATVVTSSSSPEHHHLKEKKRSLVAVETPEVPKKYRLIARTRHEGEEEVGDKPEAYDFSSHVHEGPVEDIRKETELVQVPIREYAELTETSPVAGKKQKKVKSPKKTPVPAAAPAEPADPETREIKLIARVRTEPEEPVAEPVVKEKKPKKESSSKLGFFSKTTKSSKTTGYPESSNAFTGELDPTDRTLDLEPLPFEHTQTPTTSPHRQHKKFTLFGRLRHEGDEDVVEKPDPYAFESTSYFGPFEETHFEQPLEHVPIEVKHSGESWNWKKPAPTVVPLVKREKKQKETPVVEEPEKKEIKLIARVISKPEELIAEPVVKEKKSKKESSSKFGFFSKTTKTTKTTTNYPESSAAFTGELDTTDRARDLESSPFEHPDYPAYIPKKGDEEAYQPSEHSSRPDEETVEAPAAYGFPSTSYDGPLETTVLEKDLEHSQPPHTIKTPTPVATLEKKEKKIKSPKKEKVVQPEEPERKEIKLIARIKTEPEEPVAEPVVREDKPKKESSSKFGFFSKTTKTSKTTRYPETSEAYTGELDTTDRSAEFEGTSFEHAEIPAYSPRKSEVETTVVPEQSEKVVVPEEPEKTTVRLIVHVKPQPEEEPVAEPVVKEKQPKKESSKIGFFSKTTKTTKTTGYPETPEAYTGDLDTTGRSAELEESSFEHPEYPAYAPKKVEAEAAEHTEIPTPVVPIAEPEKKRYRLIARFKHEGEEDVVHKPDPYAFDSTLYAGPLEEISRENELDHTPIADHADIRRHEEENVEEPVAPVRSPKKEKKVKSPKKEKIVLSEEPETREIRLKALVKSEPEEEPIAEKPKKKASKTKTPSFAFFSRTTKTTKTTGYPESSEAYSGDLDTTDRTKEFEGISFEHPEYHAYTPKKIEVEAPEVPEVPAEPERKRYRLIARWRHEGEEDVADKPDAYTPSSTMLELYEGPLDEIARQSELDHADIKDFTATQYPGESWNWKKTPTPVATLEKKIKSPKKEKMVTPEEPETKEIRLKALVKSEPEEEPVESVKETKPKKESSSKFGFFSKTTKTTKATGYPETAAYTGELDTTGRTEEFEGTSFEHGEIPAYSAKKIEAVTPDAPTEPEKKRYRLIARWKHEGDEDVADKPDAYTPSSNMLDLYEGPLDEIARQSELDHSWNWKKPSTLEKIEKKIKSPKKEKVEEPEEPETKEIRLKALIKSEPEEEPVESVKEKKPKKELFGFFHRSSKASSPTSESPEPAFEGPLDTTIRSDEFESIPFEHSEFTASTPIKAEQVVIEVPEEKKHSRFNWFARWRHEGDEDIVEKPSAYAFSSDVYNGPLEDLYPQGDVDQTLITEYSDVYDYEPYHPKKPVRERVKTPEPEPSDVKLVARIPPMEPEERASPVKDRPRLSSFNIFHRHSKQHHGYPEPTDVFTGDLDVTGRSQDVEKSPFEMRTDYPEYSPKVEPELPAEPPQQSRLHRLFARWRHEGEEDVVEKPDLYKFSSDVYDGPLDEMHPEGEVEQAPLQEHSEVYEYVEYRDGSKKPKSPKTSKKVAEKENTPEPSETHEVKLLTRVKSEEPEEPEVQETTPSKPFRLRFLSLAKKTQDSEYPDTSPVYEGPLDLTSRSDEMEPMPYLHGATPRYSPKITPIKRKTPEPTVEKKKYRLIARLRHDGDEDTVEKPESYGHSTEVYSGELEETHKKQEVEQVPLGEYSDLTKKEVDKKTVRLVARVPPQQESEPKKPASKFRLFPLSKSSSSNKGYPATSPTYEGPLDVTGRVKPLDHVPLETREIPAYSPRKATVSEEKVAEEPKRYRLIARFKHEGDEDVVEKPEGYIPSTKMLEPYEGPFDEISRDSEIEQTSLSGTVDVIYDVDNLKVEKRQKKKKKKRSEVPDVSDSDEQEMEPKSRFSFLRTQKPRSQVTSYPSSSYSGPLDTTNLNMDLENIPLTIPEPIIQRRVPRKYRLIHRHRHAGEEDEVAAHNLHPAFYSFPVTRHSGEIEVKSREEELPELPLRRFSRVYHSGSSATLIWNLLNPRSSRASRELEDARRPEPKKEVKLIARVLPMKKTPEKEEKPEKLTKEEQEAVETLTRSAELMDTSRTLTSGLNAINYIPSSLQYNPRPARIEGTTEDGDCYVEIRHERRAEVQLEPAYVLRETTARSHAYLSTATAVFSGVSASSSGAQASSSSTSHSLVLPSFVGSVSEDETGLHHFSWTPQQMSPQPERMSLLARLGFKRDKSKKKDKKKSNKKGENDTSGETSDSEHDEKREFAVVEFEQESGQPYTTVSTWQETSDLPEQVEVYTDENGRQITRTVKSSQVKHTVQTQSFQNYIVDGDQVPVGVVDVERSREQLTPLGQKASSSSSTSNSGANGVENGGDSSGIVETQTRTMTYEAQGGENAAPPGWAEQGLGEYVSSKSVTQGNRTIETITYKTEKDGVVETHVEHRVTIHSDGDIDHDAELSQAILEATQMNPDMVVEKIEVRQETTQ
ncbi:hypothetical protein CAEBREN_00777 [Caenorhabditis brenneri]|uniref:FERM domain-containing protein n=1 Tax=Caenorhabditis brenneri TaxID=135651 RepID=G0NCH7_CAEBE|nr:hypothetical protein CAEBREN_00777 [Caenorhabditis brenneri]